MATPNVNNFSNEKIVVIGVGTFGTAMAVLFARNGMNVTMLDRNPERCEHINTHHRNPKYLTDVDLPHTLTATTDPASALANVDMIFHAIPVQSTRCVLEQYRAHIPSSVPIISMSKGIHAETLQLMCDILADIFGKEQPTAYISGPSFAKEIALSMPTGFTVASSDLDLARRIAQRLCADQCVRAWVTDDVLGVELGGALKNVYAIAAGILEGAGYGYNTTALLVTKGCHEMMVLGHRMGAKTATLTGLAGIGDLMLTCFGPASRNRTVGVRIGRGESLADILASMAEVAEGVPTLKSVRALAQRLEMLRYLPILEFTYRMVYEGAKAEEVVKRLMTGKTIREENVLYGAGDRGADVKME